MTKNNPWPCEGTYSLGHVYWAHGGPGAEKTPLNRGDAVSASGKLKFKGP